MGDSTVILTHQLGLSWYISDNYVWHHVLFWLLKSQPSTCSLINLSLLLGKEAYNEEKWLEAKDYFESSLERFKDALSDCYFMCEDVINLNLTQPDMNEMKKSLLEEYGFKSDTMEYYELLVTAIQQVMTHAVQYVCGQLRRSVQSV